MDLQKECWGHELDWFGLEQGQVVFTSACSNEPSDSIKCGYFFD